MTPSRREPANATAADCAAALFDTVPHAMDAIRAAMRNHVGADLSVPQFRCLAFIQREKQPTMGNVAAFIGVTLPTASAMIDRLVRDGSVRSFNDPADRRRTLVETTAAGAELLQRIGCDARQSLAERLAQCSPDDLARLQRGLDVLRNTFGDAKGS